MKDKGRCLALKKDRRNLLVEPCDNIKLQQKWQLENLKDSIINQTQFS